MDHLEFLGRNEILAFVVCFNLKRKDILREETVTPRHLKETYKFGFGEIRIVCGFSKGSRSRITNYSSGKMDGKEELYGGNGKLELERFWSMGRKHGTETVYYSSGSLRSRGKWDFGNRKGKWSFWYGNGDLMKVTKYRGKGRTKEMEYKNGKISWSCCFIKNTRTDRNNIFTRSEKDGNEKRYVDGKLEDKRKWVNGYLVVAKNPTFVGYHKLYPRRW